MKRLLLVIALLTLMLLCGFALAESASKVYVPFNNGTAEIRTSNLKGITTVFLPSFAKDRIIIGDTEIDISGLSETNFSEPYETELQGTVYQFVKGKNLDTLLITSDDPVQFGREWLVDCEAHERETTGSIQLFDADGNELCAENLKKIRGRGNGTWDKRYEKAPFQITLQEKVNLLSPADKQQAAKKWVLLAEAMDPQLLHNRIAYDLALELGLSWSAESKSVDLYYDGVYCGVYTLSEKVEVGKGRVEIRDFDKAMKKLGLDKNSVTIGQDANAYGQEIHYFTGVPEIAVNAGDYLIELEGGTEEGSGTIRDDSAWFMHSQGKAYTVKSPKYASKDMVCCVSEALEELWSIIQNKGIHPVTARSIEDVLDIDAFARTALVYNYAYCPDGMTWSSFYLVYDPLREFWTPGPVWDFDLSMRYHPGGNNAGGFGLPNENENTWLAALLRVPCVQEAMSRIWQEEMKPLIQQTLLGNSQGVFLKSYTCYTEQIEVSRRMDQMIHPIPPTTQRFIIGSTIEEDNALTLDFFEKRCTWMDTSLGHMFQNPIDTVCLRCNTCYLSTEDSFSLNAMRLFNARVSEYTLSETAPADEEHFALWTVEATVIPDEGYAFADTVKLYVNGIPVSYEVLENQALRIRFSFYDRTYKPVETDDATDIGLLMDLAWFRSAYPEISVLYPDEEDLIAYYYYDGMSRGLQANAWYNPRLIRLYITGSSDEEYEYDAMSFLDYGLYEWDFSGDIEFSMNLRYSVDILP